MRGAVTVSPSSPGASVGEVTPALLSYLPAGILASPASLEQLGALSQGVKASSTVHYGAALLIDVKGFSSLARTLVAADAATSSEKLTKTLCAYLKRVLCALHARGMDVLLFAGDSVLAFLRAADEGARALAEAAGVAAEAALEVRGIAFEKRGHRLVAHTGLGAGELRQYLLRGAEGRSHGVYAGELVAQVCEAQRRSRDDQVLLSPAAAALLAPRCGPGPAPDPSGHRLLLSLAPTAALPPLAPAGGGSAMASLAPGPVASGEASAFWTNEIRTIWLVFASFPELDVERGGEGAPPAPDSLHSSSGTAGELDGRLTTRHAARFGQVVRSLHAVCAEFGGAVTKCWIDDKGASALLAFGTPAEAAAARPGASIGEENHAERALRAALALAAWFQAARAPLACGIAGGRTFRGTLGAPCRREFALMGGAVILSARLMSAARALASGGGASQQILCDAGTAAAAEERGRRLPFRLEAMPPVECKGFDAPVATTAGRPSGRTSWGGGAEGAPPPQFGREAELTRVSEAIDAACAGRGATLFIEGEPGTGKTVFAGEVLRACAARRVAVLRTEGDGAREPAPLAALAALVAGLADVARGGAAFAAGLAQRGLLPEEDALALHALLCPPEVEAVPVRGGVSGAGSDEEQQGPGSYRGSRTSLPGGALFGAAPAGRAGAILARLVGALESRPPPRSTRAPGPPSRRPPRPAPSPSSLRTRCGAPAPPHLPPPSPHAHPPGPQHWLDTSSWFVLRQLRDACPRLLLVLTARPMRDPPREYLLLSGSLHGDDDLSPPALLSPAASLAPGPSPLSRASSAAAAPSPRGSAGAAHGKEREQALRRAISAALARAASHSASEASASAQRPSAAGLQAAGKGHGARSPAAPPSSSTCASGPAPRRRRRPLHQPLGAAAGALGPRAMAEAVTKAAGVPLFIVELVRQRARQLHEAAPGAPAPPPSELARPPPHAGPPASVSFSIPDTIQQVILGQVDRLSGAAKAVLKIGAVVGSGFTRAAVQAIDPTGMDPALVCSALQELRRAGLLRPLRAGPAGRGGGAEEWPGPGTPLGFPHSLVPEAVYASMTSTQKREIHRAYARLLETALNERTGRGAAAAAAIAALGGARPGPAILAAHWKGGEEYERALVYLERAAEGAYGAGALREARRHLSELVALIDMLGAAGPVAPLPEHLRPAGVAPLPLARSRSASSALPSTSSLLPFGTAADRLAHWRRARWSALRAWAFVEYLAADTEAALELAAGARAGACLESLGERPPAPTASPVALLRLRARARGAASRVAAAPAGRPGAADAAAAAARGARTAAVDCMTLVLGAGGGGGGAGGAGWRAMSLAAAVRGAGLAEDALVSPASRARAFAAFAAALTGGRSGFEEAEALLGEALACAERGVGAPAPGGIAAARALCLLLLGRLPRPARRPAAASSSSSAPAATRAPPPPAPPSPPSSAPAPPPPRTGASHSSQAALLQGREEEARGALAGLSHEERAAARWRWGAPLRGDLCEALAASRGTLDMGPAYAVAADTLRHWREARRETSWLHAFLIFAACDLLQRHEAACLARYGPVPSRLERLCGCRVVFAEEALPGDAADRAGLECEAAAAAAAAAEALRLLAASCRARRAALLRRAAAAFRGAGLRVFEAVALARLAPLEASPEAAAAAAEAALALAAETGLRIPAVEKLRAGIRRQSTADGKPTATWG
eukprot:tig00001086_g6874.t1